MKRVFILDIESAILHKDSYEAMEQIEKYGMPKETKIKLKKLTLTSSKKHIIIQPLFAFVY